MNYGSAGVGSATHLAGEYFASRAGITMVHVPYRVSSEVLADLMTDRIQAVFASLAYTMPAIRSGKALALAVTSRNGVQTPLEVPAVRDEAIPGYEYAQWFGSIAPATASVTVLEQLARAVRSISDEKDVREQLEAQGIQPRSQRLREFDAYMKADVDKLGQVVKAAGIKPN